MSHSYSTEADARIAGKPFGGLSLEEGIEKARLFLRDGNPREALALLTGLESRYVGAVKLFDLIGDVLLSMGELDEGVKYKTLHQIVSGTFRIMTEARKPRTDMPHICSEPSLETRPEPCPSEEFAGSPVEIADETEVPAMPAGILEAEGRLFPATSSMAKEFMRQGHYERAAEIFEMLADNNPGDSSLRMAADKARKKGKEKKVLNILESWLANIEKMKSDLPSRR